MLKQKKSFWDTKFSSDVGDGKQTNNQKLNNGAKFNKCPEQRGFATNKKSSYMIKHIKYVHEGWKNYCEKNNIKHKNKFFFEKHIRLANSI